MSISDDDEHYAVAARRAAEAAAIASKTAAAAATMDDLPPLHASTHAPSSAATKTLSIDGSSASASRRLRGDERSDDLSLRSYRRGYKPEKMPVSVCAKNIALKFRLLIICFFF